MIMIDWHGICVATSCRPSDANRCRLSRTRRLSVLQIALCCDGSLSMLSSVWLQPQRNLLTGGAGLTAITDGNNALTRRGGAVRCCLAPCRSECVIYVQQLVTCAKRSRVLQRSLLLNSRQSHSINNKVGASVARTGSTMA